MAPPRPSRVLRCCSCQLFQAHQVKKSLKWTCKACGEKQSFVRAYGEGSGADCRRHVQKLNLLQGQVSELSSLRLLGEATGASRERSGPWQADSGSLQGKSQPLESRWLKYLDKEPKLGEGDLQTQPTASVEQTNPPFSPAQPRKRKWSQGTTQTSCFLDVQDLDNAEGTLECQGSSGLTMTQQSSSHCLGIAHCHPKELDFPQWKLPSPALQVKAPSSKWARFLLSPGDSSHVDTESSRRPLHWISKPADPTQDEQGTPETKTPQEGHLNGSPTTLHIPWTTCAPTSNLEGSNRKIPELSWSTWTTQTESGPLAHSVHQAPPMDLHNLFVTGEDFEEDL
uniref:MRN complex interacting protein n=1 Tax=Jaculus jaculus TaxID=51337 RepID=A0A8C5KB60_JACJA